MLPLPFLELAIHCPGRFGVIAVCRREHWKLNLKIQMGLTSLRRRRKDGIKDEEAGMQREVEMRLI